jgi:hypothetical protein
MEDVAEAKVKKESVKGSRILSANEKGLALKKLVAQIVSNINAWTTENTSDTAD